MHTHYYSERIKSLRCSNEVRWPNKTVPNTTDEESNNNEPSWTLVNRISLWIKAVANSCCLFIGDLQTCLQGFQQGGRTARNRLDPRETPTPLVHWSVWTKIEKQDIIFMRQAPYYYSLEHFVQPYTSSKTSAPSNFSSNGHCIFYYRNVLGFLSHWSLLHVPAVIVGNHCWNPHH